MDNSSSTNENQLAPELEPKIFNDVSDRSADESDAAIEVTTDHVNRPTDTSATASGMEKRRPPQDIDDVVVPAKLDRFEVRRSLGQGGSGVVFLAYDPQMHREVAIKVQRPEAISSRGLRQRFLREAHAAGVLDHPNIVSVYETGQAGEVAFIASAYCEGPSLSEWLRERESPVEPRVAAELIATLASGITHAHTRGILHRDLKPSNVLTVVAETGQTGFQDGERTLVPKICDFGLASFTNSESDLTLAGTPLGTLNYMAPEQAEGRLSDISTSTDVYGLGAILYQLLTLQVPLRGESTLETLELIRDQDPTAPSRHRAAVPRDLSAICMKALQKDPNNRYASADEFRADLRRFLAGQPILARPLSVTEKLMRWVVRSPVVASLSCLVVLSVAGLIVGQTLYSRALHRALGVAKKQTEVAATALEDKEKEYDRAEVLRREAERKERELRELNYATDMRRAIQTWRRRDLRGTKNALALQTPAEDAPDLRDFAWHFVDRSTRARPTRTFKHRSNPTACCATPDGKRLFTGAEDGQIRCWSVESGKGLFRFPAHLERVNSIAMSPDGKQIVSGSDDRVVRVWDAKSGKEIRTFRAMRSCVETVKWSPDGRWIVAGARYKEFRVWNSDGELVLRQNNDQRHESFAFSTDSKLVYVPTREHVSIWDLEHGKQVGAFRTGRVENARQIAMSNSGQFLFASEYNSSRIAVLDVATGRDIDELDGGVEYLTEMVVSPAGSHMAHVGPDGGLRVSRVREHASSLEAWRSSEAGLFAHDTPATAVCFVDETRLITCGKDRLAKLWDLDDVNPWRAIPIPTGKRIDDAGFDRLGEHLVLSKVGEKAMPQLLDVQSGDEVDVDFGQAEFTASNCSVVSRDGRWCAIGGLTGEVAVWDLATRKIVFQSDEMRGRVVSVSFSGNGLTLAASAESVCIWKSAESWAESSSLLLNCPVPNVHSLIVSPCGNQFAGQQVEQLLFWDMRKQGKPQVLAAMECSGLSFSPDSELLAACGRNRRTYVWDVATQEQILETSESAERGSATVFSRDSRVLLYGQNDGSIHAWHIPSNQSLGILHQSRVPRQVIQSLEFDRQDRRVVAVVHGPSQCILVSQ